ncbi:MSCRAMM family protein [Flavitalea antarctica]
MPALLAGEKLYLPVREVFQFLKIKTTSSASFDTLHVFFPDVKTEYQIDYLQKQIHCKGKSLRLNDDELIGTPTGLFLRTDLFQSVFELECRFDFRNLAIILSTKLELPIMRQLQQDLLHNNLLKLKKEIQPDSIIKRKFTFVRLGMSDWSVFNSSSPGAQANTRMSLRMGGMIASGEATATLSYDDKLPLSAQQQFYQWRWVNNRINALRQVTIGNIAPQAASSLFAPVTGIQLTNAPTLRKQTFGTYTISDRTEPGTTIELYINNLLIDYSKADASGLYAFNVPLFYGNNNIRLKFYSPSGEERSIEKELPIPFQLLPKNIFEYTLSTGIVNDKLNSRYAKAVFQYGLGQRTTITGGMEHLSSISKKNYIPFLVTTVRVTPNTILSTEYLHSVRSKTALSFHLPSNFQLEAGFTKYVKGQKAILTSYLEERKLGLSMPWRNNNFLLFSRLTVRQVVSLLNNNDSILKEHYSDIPKQKTTTTELTLTAVFARLNAGLATYGTIRESAQPYVYSNLSLAYRLKKGFLLQSFAQFDYTRRKWISVKEQAAKQLSGKGAVTLSWERNFSSKSMILTFGIHYDFRAAKTTTSIVHNGDATTLVTTASGSLLYASPDQSLSLSNRSQVGRGGIILYPFLDLNCNGVKDKDEPGISGLKFRCNGGRILPDERHSSARIVDMEPYRNYLIELDDNSFGNIAWQIKNKRLSVEIEPNSIKQVEVPVAVLGEVSGMIYLDKVGKQKGLSNVLVEFYDSNAKFVAHTVSGSDGYFSFLGLVPGKYKATIHQSVVRKLQLPGAPSIAFTIEKSMEGSVISGLKFLLQDASDKMQPKCFTEQQLRE